MGMMLMLFSVIAGSGILGLLYGAFIILRGMFLLVSPSIMWAYRKIRPHKTVSSIPNVDSNGTSEEVEDPGLKNPVPEVFYYDKDGNPRACSDDSLFWGKVFETEQQHGKDYCKYLFPKGDCQPAGVITITGGTGGYTITNGGQLVLNGGISSYEQGLTSGTDYSWFYQDPIHAK